MGELNYEVESSLSESLLYIELDNEWGYERKMLLEGSMPGIIRPELGSRGGRECLCYDISPLISLKQLLEIQSLSEAQVRALAENITMLIKGLEEYLLPEESLVLLPELIFYDEGCGGFRFVLCSGGRNGLTDGLRRLFRWLLDGMDYASDDGIVLVYRMYRQLMRDSFKLGDLLQPVRREKNEEDFSEDEGGIFRFDVMEPMEAVEEPSEYPDTGCEGGCKSTVYEAMEGSSGELSIISGENCSDEKNNHNGAAAFKKKALLMLLGAFTVMTGLPAAIYFLEGYERLVSLLPFLIIVDIGVALAVALELLLLRGTED